MKKFVENLRKKPESARRRILLLITISITALILIWWLFSFISTL